jgi:L-2-hydroxyglutarate oxidase LhgO
LSLPFLGVHFTKRIDGNIDVGPNAMLAFSREHADIINIKDVWTMITSRAFWSLIQKQARFGLRELYYMCHPRGQIHQLQSYLPELTINDVVQGPTGIRAQALTEKGLLVDDFVFQTTHQQSRMHVRNAPSPAATSSLAIAEHIVDQVVTILPFLRL